MLTQKLARCSDVSRAARSPFQPFTMKRSRSDSDPEEGDGFERHHRRCVFNGKIRLKLRLLLLKISILLYMLSSAGVDGGDYDVGRAKKKRRGVRRTKTVPALKTFRRFFFFFLRFLLLLFADCSKLKRRDEIESTIHSPSCASWYQPQFRNK